MLFHITSEAELHAAQLTGEYRPAAFELDRFIHCSHASQVEGVANRLFRGRSDLVLLEIDPRALTCPVVEENLEGGTELYPHIYGALPLEAVAGIHAFPFDGEGRFRLPRAIAAGKT